MYQENSTTYEDDKVEEEGSPFQKSLIGWWMHCDTKDISLVG